MFDPSLGYDNSIDTTTDGGLINSLSWFGISAIIKNSYLFKDSKYSNIMFNKYIVNTYSEILSNEDNLNIICSKAANENINLYQHPVWTDFLNTQFETGLKNPALVYGAFRDSNHYLNYLLKWKQDVDWMEVYNLYFARQKNISYVSQSFSYVLRKYFANNPLCARISIEADLFEAEQKPDSNVRTEMYAAYIEAGFLDKKKARKIRSETSEYTSMRSVMFLTDIAESNPKLYPNIDELLLQFSDTKHYSVQEIIANRAPFRILYAFVGFESKEAKRILENRMQNGK